MSVGNTIGSNFPGGTYLSVKSPINKAKTYGTKLY